LKLASDVYYEFGRTGSGLNILSVAS